ncbi:hypothetical protein [Stutzerimonas xanthomarina]|uniref:hypothetical protein n=1 Tax=Stutzerimonas xanthomarina TaxID=271420 RepID=UPI003AA8ABB3
MNSILKAAGNLGAELGAAKAENDRLREVLRCIADLPMDRRSTENDYRLSAAKAIALGALSQQAEPTDTYTATDMINQSAQAFRDGQAAQVSYPDFRPQLSALVKACQRYIDSDGAECFPDDALIEATVALERDAHAASVRYAARPAQIEQHDSDCSTNNRGVPDLLGPCDCSLSEASQ